MPDNRGTTIADIFREYDSSLSIIVGGITPIDKEELEKRFRKPKSEFGDEASTFYTRVIDTEFAEPLIQNCYVQRPDPSQRLYKGNAKESSSKNKRILNSNYPRLTFLDISARELVSDNCVNRSCEFPGWNLRYWKRKEVQELVKILQDQWEADYERLNSLSISNVSSLKKDCLEESRNAKSKGKLASSLCNLKFIEEVEGKEVLRHITKVDSADCSTTTSWELEEPLISEVQVMKGNSKESGATSSTTATGGFDAGTDLNADKNSVSANESSVGANESSVTASGGDTGVYPSTISPSYVTDGTYLSGSPSDSAVGSSSSARNASSSVPVSGGGASFYGCSSYEPQTEFGPTQYFNIADSSVPTEHDDAGEASVGISPAISDHEKENTLKLDVNRVIPIQPILLDNFQIKLEDTKNKASVSHEFDSQYGRVGENYGSFEVRDDRGIHGLHVTHYKDGVEVKDMQDLVPDSDNILQESRKSWYLNQAATSKVSVDATTEKQNKMKNEKARNDGTTEKEETKRFKWRGVQVHTEEPFKNSFDDTESFAIRVDEVIRKERQEWNEKWLNGLATANLVHNTLTIFQEELMGITIDEGSKFLKTKIRLPKERNDGDQPAGDVHMVDSDTEVVNPYVAYYADEDDHLCSDDSDLCSDDGYIVTDNKTKERLTADQKRFFEQRKARERKAANWSCFLKRGIREEEFYSKDDARTAKSHSKKRNRKGRYGVIEGESITAVEPWKRKNGFNFPSATDEECFECEETKIEDLDEREADFQLPVEQRMPPQRLEECLPNSFDPRNHVVNPFTSNLSNEIKPKQTLLSPRIGVLLVPITEGACFSTLTSQEDKLVKDHMAAFSYLGSTIGEPLKIFIISVVYGENDTSQPWRLDLGSTLSEQTTRMKNTAAGYNIDPDQLVFGCVYAERILENGPIEYLELVLELLMAPSRRKYAKNFFMGVPLKEASMPDTFQQD